MPTTATMKSLLEGSPLRQTDEEHKLVSTMVAGLLVFNKLVTTNSSTARKIPQVSTQSCFSLAQTDADIASRVCSICKKDPPELTSQKIFAATECGHLCCFECALRRLFVANNCACAFCEEPLKAIILTRKKFASSGKVAQFVKANMRSSKIRNFFDIVNYLQPEESTIYDHIKELLWFQCLGCNFDFSKHLLLKDEIKSLSHYVYIHNHLLTKHKSYLCDLCYFNEPKFPIEYEDFNSSELAKHKRRVHVQCGLCRDGEHYFDQAALLGHCIEMHEKCDICSRKDGASHFAHDKTWLAAHQRDAHEVLYDAETLRPIENSKLKAMLFGTEDLGALYPFATSKKKGLEQAPSARPNNEQAAGGPGGDQADLVPVERRMAGLSLKEDFPDLGGDGPSGPATKKEDEANSPAAKYLNLGRAAVRNFKRKTTWKKLA